MSDYMVRTWETARPELLPHDCDGPCIFCGCPLCGSRTGCDCDLDPEPAPAAPSSALARAAELARMGRELAEAKRRETLEEKHLRWQEERKLRAAAESERWDWTPAGGVDWIVQTHTLECERVGGYRVSRGACTCGDGQKRGEVVICKHRLGLQAKLERMMDQVYRKAA